MKLSDRHRNFGSIMAAINDSDPERKAAHQKHARTAARIHGGRNTPEYQAWRGMKSRCHNPKHHAFKHYGGRGIVVFQEWRESFAAFRAYMGARPSNAHSIDRWPNPDGNYEPGNVRWATDIEQNRNRGKYNAVVEWRGENKTIAEWSEVLKIPVDRLYWRLSRADWTADRAFQIKDGRLTRNVRPKMSPEARANMSAGQKRRRSKAREVK